MSRIRKDRKRRAACQAEGFAFSCDTSVSKAEEKPNSMFHADPGNTGRHFIVLHALAPARQLGDSSTACLRCGKPVCGPGDETQQQRIAPAATATTISMTSKGRRNARGSGDRPGKSSRPLEPKEYARRRGGGLLAAFDMADSFRVDAGRRTHPAAANTFCGVLPLRDPQDTTPYKFV